jgi:hypothetical protein
MDAMFSKDHDGTMGAAIQMQAEVVVEFVETWIEHTTDRLITGYDVDVLMAAWREEMQK